MNTTALILAAHGSRREPDANELVRAHTDRIRAMRLFDEVVVAFHHGDPTFPEVLDTVRADDITVVPVMTSDGYFSNTVLPRALSSNPRIAQTRLRITDPVGTHSGVLTLAQDRVTTLLEQQNLDPRHTAAVIVGHGTKRNPRSKHATIDLAVAIHARRLCAQVLPAFLDDNPSIETVLDRIAQRDVLILPFLIGRGNHALRDIPARAAGDAPGGWHRVYCDSAIGEHPGLTDLIVDLATSPQTDADAPQLSAPPPSFGGDPTRTASPRPAPLGTVYLVGAGPGDPDLITVRGLRLLKRADVVVYDRLAPAELLEEVPRRAERVNVGKAPGNHTRTQDQINGIIVDRARRHRTIVRLKGGDPFVFGRGAEELDACTRAGVPCVVVPGVSSAIAGPGAAGIPVTHRGLARSFAIITAHTEQHAERSPRSAATPPNLDYRALASIDTLVIMMGCANLRDVTLQLIAAGRDPATPAACIERATTPDQRVITADLATIAEAADRDQIAAPMLTVIGPTAAFAGADSGSGLSACAGANSDCVPLIQCLRQYAKHPNAIA